MPPHDLVSMEMNKPMSWAARTSIRNICVLQWKDANLTRPKTQSQAQRKKGLEWLGAHLRVEILGWGSINPFPIFGTLWRMAKNSSNPNPHVSGDRLPAKSLCAKCRDPLGIQNTPGTAEAFALCPGIPETSFHALDDQ